jgi:hypothetical protein
MEKMVPTETLTSMLEEPSRGQHHVLGVTGELGIEGDEVLLLLGRHAAHLATGLQRRLEALIGVDVQLLPPLRCTAPAWSR